MSFSRAETLINKLISNKISEGELAELLTAITDEEERKVYADALEIYFNRLLNENSSANGSAAPKDS
ncbi:hypothetical protein LZD49_24645 [Dyadobacter sp. CY261]|uniref:hypothetical protein n=1 Tax=Dyadobacter sp. CY261 TaxID=2907203 RepID=UPI001F1EAD11|nr:hypothetical protein [Dyadobacter sp. CY261]MCF0073691.1 hypothetical protein [Dyadobacter sp. CY261]